MLNPTQEERLKTLTAETLGVDTDEIQDDSAPATIATWTSFNHLTLIAAVEESFHCTFSMEEMTQITTYAGLRQAVAAHTT